MFFQLRYVVYHGKHTTEGFVAEHKTRFWRREDARYDRWWRMFVSRFLGCYPTRFEVAPCLIQPRENRRLAPDTPNTISHRIVPANASPRSEIAKQCQKRNLSIAIGVKQAQQAEAKKGGDGGEERERERGKGGGGGGLAMEEGTTGGKVTRAYEQLFLDAQRLQSL